LSRIFWVFMYRFLIFPSVFIIAHMLSIFSHKIREAVGAKYSVYKNIQKWVVENTAQDQRNIMFHAASLGEFEHIRPLLYQLKNRFKTNNIITFFSPSGFRNVKHGNGVDYYCYMPFDTLPGWEKIYRLVNPIMVVVAKHDVWPAHVWSAKNMNIPIYLVNASLSAKSTRSIFPFGRILSSIYREFTEIMAISEEDSKRFAKSFRGLNLSVTGDTKYDQVLVRREKAKEKPLISSSWKNASKIIVAGSIWPEDENHLIPAFYKLLKENADLKLALVPHEPINATITRLKGKFAEYRPDQFSMIKETSPTSRILIVDEIGHLAGLYYFADIAYVGGSFRQGIHNTMEPAIYGIPVLYGPVHTNSYEAIKLLESGGAIVVKNNQEIYQILAKLLADKKLAFTIGEKAQKYALSNTGATEKLITKWYSILKG